MKCNVVKGAFSVGICHKPLLDLTQPESHDHCWLINCYTDDCSDQCIPPDAVCVGINDVIALTYDGIAKQLSIVVNDVCVYVVCCVVCVCCVLRCVCMLCVVLCCVCIRAYVMYSMSFTMSLIFV